MQKRDKKRAVFLDRDGIFNRAPIGNGHITRLADLKIMDGIERLVKNINDLGRLAIMVSNQSCIERGTLTLAGLAQLTDAIHAHLAMSGAVLDGVYYCHHQSERGCACRKPNPGMLLEAAKKYNIDLSKSYMVGDRWFDVGAGRAAGCQTIFLADGERNKKDLTICQPDYIVNSLDEALEIIKN